MTLNGWKNSSTTYMETHKLLDRFELLYPQVNELADLRRAYIDKDVSSIFRLLPQDVTGDIDDLRKAVLENNLNSLFRLVDDEDLRKLLLEDNIWKLWPVLSRYTDTHFVAAFKNFSVNETEIWEDCFARGQLQSKQWIVTELEKLEVELGTVFLCAGWYATLATMLFESDINVDNVRSFDFDPSCVSIAKVFNKPWLRDDWKFQASIADILDIDYNSHTFSVTRSDGTLCEMTNSPDTIINTSCEHIADFDKWYNSIPSDKLVILQSNNYFEVDEHVNCVVDQDEFDKMAPMSNVLYTGELELEKYTRFMRIGYK